MKWLWGTLFLLLSAPAPGASIYTFVPRQVDPSRNYLIYLHGAIIESKGPQPVSPQFGVYEYQAILDALASRGAVVISQPRAHGTDVNAYAGFVISQIYQLLRAGVPPGHIAVVGFSKGGDIAIHVSSFLRMKDIHYVFLAACWPKPKEPQLRLTGHVFAVYETSDTFAGFSCRPMTEHRDKPASFKEIHISTGFMHGAFFKPRKQWVVPVLDDLYGARR